MSPAANVSRFGVYATDVLKLRPKAVDPQLAEIDFTDLQQAPDGHPYWTLQVGPHAALATRREHKLAD